MQCRAFFNHGYWIEATRMVEVAPQVTNGDLVKPFLDSNPTPDAIPLPEDDFGGPPPYDIYSR